MSGEPDLRQGDSGEWVTYLLQLLRQAGYWDYGDDDQFTEYVDEAVKRFQDAKGLSTDGVVGQGTWDALTANTSGTTPESGAAATPEQGGGIPFDWNEFPTLWEMSQLGSEEAVKQDLIAMGINPPQEGDEEQAYA